MTYFLRKLTSMPTSSDKVLQVVEARNRLATDDVALTADKLATQTEKLVKFTKYLLWFTIALVICAFIQVGIMIFDCWLQKQLFEH
jgi:hypothetical protein